MDHVMSKLVAVTDEIEATKDHLDVARRRQAQLVTEALDAGVRWPAINEACGTRNMQATYKRRTSN